MFEVKDENGNVVYTSNKKITIEEQREIKKPNAEDFSIGFASNGQAYLYYQKERIGFQNWSEKGTILFTLTHNTKIKYEERKEETSKEFKDKHFRGEWLFRT